MTVIRVGIVLVVVDLAYAIPFLWACGLLIGEDPYIENRGAGITFFIFGLLLPFLVGSVGAFLVAVGWTRRRAARTRAAAGADQADERGALEAPPVVPWLMVTALIVVSIFVGAFGYGGGEAFALPEETRLAIRIADHWQRCDKPGVSVEYASIIAMVPPDAERCIDCLDDHEDCGEQPECDALCSVEPTAASLEAFGGIADPSLFGIWDAGADDDRLTLVLSADTYELSAASRGGETQRGRWAAVAHGRTWQIMMEPQDNPRSRNASDYEIVGPGELRWTDRATGTHLLWRRRAEPEPESPPQVDTQPSAEQVDACNRACWPFRSCMRDLQSAEACSEELSRACRDCRAEGLGRGSQPQAADGTQHLPARIPQAAGPTAPAPGVRRAPGKVHHDAFE